MYSFPIGVMLDSFRLPTAQAIKSAAATGASGIQMYSTNGENSPEALTSYKRRELLNLVKDNGLVFSALCGDLGRGFYNRELIPSLTEKSKRILELAKELETDIVTTHIGVVPSDKESERYKIMQEACRNLACYADTLDAHFAVETGPETAAVLKSFLDSLDSRGVAVNLDPANLVMVTGDNPVQAVYTLKDYIVHTHAKDGIRIFEKDPKMVYGVVPDMMKDKGPSYLEKPLGKGAVNFPDYLSALDDIGYKGFLTVERECGDKPGEDITAAVGYLSGIIGR